MATERQRHGQGRYFKIPYLDWRRYHFRTQTEKLQTKKSAISRIENHAEDIRLSTLVNYAQALGKQLHLEVA